MKNLKKSMRFACALLFSLVAVATHAHGYGTAEKKTVICGRVEDLSAISKGTFKIMVSKAFQSPEVYLDVNEHIVTFHRDSFHVTLRTELPLFYIRFDNLKLRDNGYPYLYLMQKGDSLHLKIDKKGFIRWDRNNTLFNFQRSLFRSRRDIRPLMPPSGLPNKEAIRYVTGLVQPYLNGRDSILAAYKRSVPEPVFALVARNYRDAVWHEILMTLDMWLINRLDLEESMDLLEKIDAMAKQMDRVTERFIIDQSLSYSLNLGLIRLVQARLMQKADPSFDVFAHMYNSVKAIPHRHRRESAMVSLFKMRVDSCHNPAFYFEDAARTIRDPSLLSKLASLDVRRPGSKMPNFEFRSLNGEKVTLADFKDKTIVAHFWYTGCIPCANMVVNTRELFEKYADNPEIVFLNINVDTSRERWVKGVESKRYTHENEIILGTDGLGKNHPILRYFNYYGFPQLLVIGRKGELISANPPRCLLKEDVPKLGKLLDEAIL